MDDDRATLGAAPQAYRGGLRSFYAGHSTGGWLLVSATLRLAPEVPAWLVADMMHRLGLSVTAPQDSSPAPTPREQLRDLLMTKGRLTRKEVVAAIGCSPVSARRWLNELVEQGRARFCNHSNHPRTGYWEKRK